MKVVFVLVALGFLKTVWIYKTTHALPLAELKRRARAGDARAEAIYKVAAYGRGLDGLVWLFGLSLAIGLVLWTARINWWAAALTIIIMLWLAALAPMASPDGLVWKAFAFFATKIAKVLEYIKTPLGWLGHLVPARRSSYGIYEKDDLLELLKNQIRTAGNRISEADLKTASAALTFTEVKVADCMVPRAKARFVAASEPIGPMLMDELHKTGQVRFGVVKEAVGKNEKPQITGSLYLGDLLKNLESSGHVSSIASKNVAYINESADLAQALDAFVKSGSQLLVVVNKFEEVAGTLSLEDVLQKLLGYVPASDFSDYNNPAAVSGLAATEE